MACIHTYIHIHAYAHTQRLLYVSMYVCCMYLCMSTYIHSIHTYKQTNIHACMHTYTHIKTHSYVCFLSIKNIPKSRILKHARTHTHTHTIHTHTITHSFVCGSSEQSAWEDALAQYPER